MRCGTVYRQEKEEGSFDTAEPDWGPEKSLANRFQN
jgi:hypothetical protein